MQKLINAIKVFLLKNNFLVEKKNKKEYKRDVLKENYSRLAIISIVLLLIECYLYLIEIKIFGVGPVLRIFIIVCFVFLPFIQVIKYKSETINITFALIVQYLFAAVCILFGVALALYIQSEADLIHMYLMMVLCTAAFVYISPLGSAVLFGVTYLGFTLLLPGFVPDPKVALVIKINAGCVNFAAWLMSGILWRSKITAFLNRKLLYEKNVILKEISKKDAMTGLYNHEASLRILEKEIRRAKAMNIPISLIIADIDNFKNINDRYGHLIGDEVIKSVSEKISSAVRKTDFVGRYGGDEFIIIMPDTDLKAALALTKRMKREIESDICYKNISVTLSGGLSQFGGGSMNEFIRLTDQKLYTAKNTGKNKFETKPGSGKKKLEKALNTV